MSPYGNEVSHKMRIYLIKARTDCAQINFCLVSADKKSESDKNCVD